MRKYSQTIRALALTSSVTALAGCSVLEPFTSPQANLPDTFVGGGAPVGEVAQVRWWESFNDAQLNGLVDRGLSQNLNLKIAQERFTASAAVARGTGIAVNGSASSNSGFRGGSDAIEEGFITGTLQVSWLLDFFGRLSNQRAAAAADLEAAGYTIEDTRLVYLSQLTTAYINARFFQNSLTLTRRTLASRQRTVDLTQQIVDAGAATVVDLTRARGLVDETRADIPRLEAQFRIAAHRVATLLGQPAGTLVGQLSQGAAQPSPRSLYGAGVPADLLRNRPDIKVAERQLAAAVAEIGVARSALYPSISLTGNITGVGTDTINAGDGSSWSFGPTINLPIFGREALYANLSLQESAAREAWLVWQQTVLAGVEEVENALVSVSRSRQVVAAERRATRTLEEALSLSQEAYTNGEQSILDVLDAERRVGDARIAEAAAQQQYAIDFVTLNVAIGAGRGPGGGIAPGGDGT